MTKIISVPNSKKHLLKLLEKDIDGVLISIKDLSVNNNYSVTVNELNKLVKIIKNKNKLVFISLNKLMHNSDIPLLKEVLIKLNNIDIDNVLFYDLSVIQISKRINFNKPLGVFQNHLNNSIYSNNFYKHFCIDYSVLSKEITLEEIFEIKNKTNMKLIIPVFGYIPMFYSNRYLLTSYFDYIKKDKKDNYYYILDNDNYHIVKEEKYGTSIYNGNIIDLDYEFSLMIKNNIDYVLLYSEFVKEDEYLNIIDKYISIKNGKKIEKNNLNKGFAYTKTTYKVGNNE